MLNEGHDEAVLPDAAPSNVVPLCRARLELTRHLVALIDERHRTWKRYPVLAALAKTSSWDPEALGLAYLRHLRLDLEVASARRRGPKQSGGSMVALCVVEGRSEGP